MADVEIYGVNAYQVCCRECGWDSGDPETWIDVADTAEGHRCEDER